MTAAAYDDVIVLSLRRDITPSGLPAFVTGECFFDDT
jgi:hypothetical protein